MLVGAQPCALLAVAVAARCPSAANEVANLVVGLAGAERGAKVDSLRRKQTSVENAFGRQPRARARAAKRFADRRDKTDLALAVVEDISLGDFAVIVLLRCMRRPLLVDASEQVARWHDAFAAPIITIAHVHIFDEAHDDAGAAKALDQIHDRVIVYA